MIPKAERGQYDLVGAVRGYVAYLRDLAVKAQAGAPDFVVERAGLIKPKADLAEDGGERPPQRTLPGDAVEAAWTAVLDRLLTCPLVLPDRLAPLCRSRRRLPGFAIRSAPGSTWRQGDRLARHKIPAWR